jgi:hypothetical protein
VDSARAVVTCERGGWQRAHAARDGESCAFVACVQPCRARFAITVGSCGAAMHMRCRAARGLSRQNTARWRIPRRRFAGSRLTVSAPDLPFFDMTIVLWAMAAAVSLGLVAMCKTARMR